MNAAESPSRDGCRSARAAALNDVLNNLHFMVNRDFREQTNIVVAAESESDKIDSILVLMHKNPPVSSVT